MLDVYTQWFMIILVVLYAFVAVMMGVGHDRKRFQQKVEKHFEQVMKEEKPMSPMSAEELKNFNFEVEVQAPMSEPPKPPVQYQRPKELTPEDLAKEVDGYLNVKVETLTEQLIKIESAQRSILDQVGKLKATYSRLIEQEEKIKKLIDLHG